MYSFAILHYNLKYHNLRAPYNLLYISSVYTGLYIQNATSITTRY